MQRNEVAGGLSIAFLAMVKQGDAVFQML